MTCSTDTNGESGAARMGATMVAYQIRQGRTLLLLAQGTPPLLGTPANPEPNLWSAPGSAVDPARRTKNVTKKTSILDRRAQPRLINGLGMLAFGPGL
jgi:hypothetical protein